MNQKVPLWKYQISNKKVMVIGSSIVIAYFTAVAIYTLFFAPFPKNCTRIYPDGRIEQILDKNCEDL